MQALLTETKAKETAPQKKLQKKSIEKRNLFGLGLTSLIAACGADKAAGGSGDGGNPGEDNNDDKNPPPTATLPFEAVKLEKLAEATDSGFKTDTGGGISEFIVSILEVTTELVLYPNHLTFSDGAAHESNAVKIYQLTTTEGQYDLVISSYTINRDTSSEDHRKGKVFIYWNMTEIQSEGSRHLEITGATIGDQIGTYAPEFLQLGGADNNHDMVIRSEWVDKIDGSGGAVSDTGAIYILWDVADYYGPTKTIDLASIADATSGSLAIYGAKASDEIGTYAPEFLQIGGVADDNKLDMVIRSEWVTKNASATSGVIYILWDIADYKTETLNKNIILDDLSDEVTFGSLAIYGAKVSDQIGTYAPDFLQLGGEVDNYDMVIRSHKFDKSGTGAEINEGAIYILWDVADYHNTASLHHTITLDASVTGATSGSLAIYGARQGDQIGRNAPEFLQLGGEVDNYDMVIRSEWVDKSNTSINFLLNEGAIYILWDVADYYDTASLNHTVNLDASVTDATSGSLTIYGAKPYDQVGTYAPEFLQIGGKGDNYDMVIRSELVDKAGNGAFTNEGAIYVLWDVADYYSAETDKNKTIDLGNLADATSGLLTIYGRNETYLGSDSNNILYDDAGELTNIDNDADGTKDIALTDGMYTYIFFGDKVADKNGGTEVVSKTIDLATVNASLTDPSGFFSYDFDGNGSAAAIERVGYRFAENDIKTNLAEVVLPSPLSDADTDLAVWDIA